MRIAHAAIALSVLTAAFPFACGGTPQTLGFLPPGDAAASDAMAAADQAGDTPTFGDGATTTSGTCEAADGGTGGTAAGCEFFTAEPDSCTQALNSCFAAYVSNGGTTDVTITLDFGGSPIKNFAHFARVPSGSGPAIKYGPLGGAGNVLHAGQVAILFLAGPSPSDTFAIRCPAGITPAFQGDAAQHGTGVGKAFHIQTDSLVTAYDIYPYGGGSSAYTAASLLLPTSAWDTNYIAVDGYSTFRPWISIVALHDGTQVTIRPTADIVSVGGLSGATKGTTATYSVNRGQVLQFTQDDELVGSPITSTYPIGLFGGVSCMNVPSDKEAWDTGHQQIPPVHALGSEYVYTRYRDRYKGVPESPPVRIVGAVDGTILTYDPAAPSGAPPTIGAGQMVEFDAYDVFTVSSQDNLHPFYVAAYMTGASAYNPGSGTDDGRGDPEFVNVVPPAQFGKSYVLFTDPTYPETELVVVRQRGPSGFADVQLDCLGGNIAGWMEVGASGKYQYARVDLVTAGFMPQGNCDNGQHGMSSALPFGVTVWGWGSSATGGDIDPNTGMGTPTYSQYVSYAYPGGTGVAAINPVVTQ